MTNITLSFPNWFYMVFSIGILAGIFYLGCRWRTLNEICGEFPKIRRALDLISQKLCELGHFKEQVYISTASPKKITEVGMHMLVESKLKELIDKNKDEFIKKIEARKPSTDYDIEQLAIDIMMSLSEDPRMEPTKQYAFQNGKDLNLMLLASGIYLRDITLQKKEPGQQQNP